MLKKINKLFHNYSYIIYLCTLVFWIGFLPLFEITGMIRFLEFIIGNVIFLSAFYFFYHSKKKVQAFIFLPIVIILSYVHYFIPDNENIAQIDRFSLFMLFFLITMHLLGKIFNHKEVDSELIIISISGYIMIGFMSSILCWFTYVFYPGSYNINIDNYGPIVDFTYYAIVTMSTLGYGDVIPLLPQSRSLAIVITLVGQFYMAILIGLLIGKFVSQRKQ